MKLLKTDPSELAFRQTCRIADDFLLALRHAHSADEAMMLRRRVRASIELLESVENEALRRMEQLPALPDVWRPCVVRGR